MSLLVRPLIRLTRTKEVRAGQVLILCQLLENGEVKHNLHVVSGQPHHYQIFRHAKDPKSVPVSMEPIPQGWYTTLRPFWAQEELGVPIYNAGIGKWFCPILPRQIMKRSEFGFHKDYNRSVSPGSAGCPVHIYDDHEEIFLDWINRAPDQGVSTEVQWETPWPS